MIVYALYDIYCDDCDLWENIVDLYANIEDAYAAKVILDAAVNNPERQSYDVREMGVKLSLETAVKSLYN